MAIVGLDHVQIAITPGGEEAARRFYGSVLGMTELPKPATLAGPGGVWFACGVQQLHCGVEEPVAPSRRHPALLTDDLDAVRARLEGVGFPIRTDAELPGYRRFYTEDPFGNRLECIEKVETPRRAELASGPLLAAPSEGPRSRLDALSDLLIFRSRPVSTTAGRLVTLAGRRVGDSQASVQPPVDVQGRSLIVPADHEDCDLPAGGESDQDAPLASPGQVNAADPLDLLAGQPVVGRLATAACQVGLRPFRAASNIRSETSYVLFGDARPEDIESNGQLDGRLWTKCRLPDRICSIDS